MSDINIFNVKVWGVREALLRAFYPMETVVSEDMSLDARTIPMLIKDKPVLKALGKSPVGHGDDKFLRQITVGFDLLAPRYFWAEFDTYHYTVKNSQSTMHKGRMLDYKKLANGYVDNVILARFQSIVEEYNADPTTANLQRLKSNMPEGIRLAAGITTNYAQLKTIFFQRAHHRLPEWHVFCSFIKTLPYAEQLGVCCLNENPEN
jgi:hypothetical protein